MSLVLRARSAKRSYGWRKRVRRVNIRDSVLGTAATLCRCFTHLACRDEEVVGGKRGATTAGCGLTLPTSLSALDMALRPLVGTPLGTAPLVCDGRPVLTSCNSRVLHRVVHPRRHLPRLHRPRVRCQRTCLSKELDHVRSDANEPGDLRSRCSGEAPSRSVLAESLEGSCRLTSLGLIQPHDGAAVAQHCYAAAVVCTFLRSGGRVERRRR